ncbi:hypothetical protein ABPG75_003844 [Micractinium tetrahymenae]
MLEAVLHGALAGGTNKPTLVLLNTCLLGCIFVGASLFLPALGLPRELLPHIAVLLVLAAGLLASINWLVAQTGTVAPEEQRRELFGDEAQRAQQAQQAADRLDGEGPAAGDPAAERKAKDQ